MARNLRSSSHARSMNSRPSTPRSVQAPVNTSSLEESSILKYQRRSGRFFRIQSHSARASPAREQAHSGYPGSGFRDTVNGKKSDDMVWDWTEPRVRTPVPSYKDTPWSAVSTEANPILSTMRPLGAMPTAADLRKVGLAPGKVVSRVPPVKSSFVGSMDGTQDEEQPTSTDEVMTDAAEAQPTPVLHSVAQEPSAEDLIATLDAMPMPESDRIDVARLKIAVEQAIRQAYENNKNYIARGLLRIWSDSYNDPFQLHVMNGVVATEPADRNMTAFRALFRMALRNDRVDDMPHPAAAAPGMARAQSAASTSSLSSAQSVEPDHLAQSATTVAASGSTRTRNGSARAATAVAAGHTRSRVTAPRVRRSAFPSATEAASKRKRDMEEDPNFTDAALAAKRARLQTDFSDVAGPESGVRSSISSRHPSRSASPPAPNVNTRSQKASSRAAASNVPASTSPAGPGGRRRSQRARLNNPPGENYDICRQCGDPGDLLCCDSCPNSFHFSCLSPPLDPANPPEGEWNCPICNVQNPFGAIDENTESRATTRDFALPVATRTFFSGVETGPGGKYEKTSTAPKNTSRAARGSKTGRYDDPTLYKLYDSQGRLVVCIKCRKTSEGFRPLIQCDYCPCYWHLDCVDPPLANPPVQKPGSNKPYHNWMCPNHIDHELYTFGPDEDGEVRPHKHRRPRNPRYVDVDVIPESDEEPTLKEQEQEGVIYRVAENGLKLNFLGKVKCRRRDQLLTKKQSENLIKEIREEGARRFAEAARPKYDELVAQATEYYSSPNAKPPLETAAGDIIRSRTAAERAAVAGLVAISKGHGHPTQEDADAGKIGHLVDQLRAQAPESFPAPETELQSLRALQALIARRLEVMESESEPQQP